MTHLSNPSSGDTATCPVTGLAIERRPDWRVESPDGTFGEDIEVIGGRVLHVRPRGHAGLAEMEQVIALRARVVAEAVADGRTFVQLADYRDLQSTDAAGRRRFTEAMISTPRLAGIVFFGVAPLLKLAINLGRRFHMITRPADVVETYDQGIRRALAILESVDSGMHPAYRNGAGSEAVVKRRDLELEGLLVQLEALPPDHLRAAVTGFFEERHLDSIFVAMDEVAQVLEPGFAIDVDVTGMRGVSLAVRRQYVARLTEWHRRWNFASYTLHGGNALNRAAAIVTRPFVPFDLRVAADSGKGTRSVRWPWFRRRVSSREIDALLEYFAGIDWSAPNTESRAPVDARNGLLGPIFDVVDLMTADVSQLLAERQLTEDALRQSEERHRTILDNIADGFYEVDLRGNLVLVNDAFLKMLDCSESEVLGVNYRRVVAPEDVDRVFATFNQVFETGEPARAFNWELVRKDGTRLPIEASVAIKTAGDGTAVGFRGIIRDVSERARAERDRAALEAQLRVAQRLEALGTLAGGIAHNFNNLLMGIQGNAALLRMGLEQGDPRSQRLDAISSLVDGGSRLTKQLLGYARAGRYDVAPVDLDEIIESTLETFAATRQDVRVHRELDGSLPAVEADAGQIEQVLMNLFINAADAMPTGGDLTVSTGVVSRSEVSGSGGELQASDHVALSVRDTGIGMDALTIERIFEPFFTTKGLHRGTGLGLASVYGIVTSHRGAIAVDSEPNVGTTFRIFLPVTDREPQARGAEDGETPSGKGVVVVVDDDAMVLEATTSMLEMLGYEVCAVTSGRDAIDAVSERGGEIDLVILDLVLPDLHGGAVFDALRALRSDLKVLLCSGYSLDGDAAGILARGCDGFIQKPFTMQKLATTVSTLVDPGPPTH